MTKTKTKVCEECGQPFEAKRSTARFCSPYCRLRAYRNVGPLIPSDSPPPIPPSTAEDVLEAVYSARRLANSFSQLSASSPEALRDGCARVSVAISDALDGEGW